MGCTWQSRGRMETQGNWKGLTCGVIILVIIMEIICWECGGKQPHHVQTALDSLLAHFLSLNLLAHIIVLPLVGDSVWKWSSAHGSPRHWLHEIALCFPGAFIINRDYGMWFSTWHGLTGLSPKRHPGFRPSNQKTYRIYIYKLFNIKMDYFIYCTDSTKKMIQSPVKSHWMLRPSFGAFHVWKVQLLGLQRESAGHAGSLPS